MATPDTRYEWDESIQRYRDRVTGRVVSEAAVVAATDQMIAGSRKEMERLANQLRDGSITLAAWQAAMASEIKTVNLASAAAACGGWKNMTQADFGRAGAEIKAQYGYLRNFAKDIASGKQKPDGTLARRATLYADSARGYFYETLRRLSGVRLGHRQERRVLGAAEHCPECVAFAARGWVPLGTLPRPGQDSRCRTRCKCRLETRKA